MTKKREKWLKRFWDKVERKGPNQCWEWTAAIDTSGYGSFWRDGAMRTAHRIAWMLANGDIPHGSCVLHKCDNRKCCNPDHLWLGSRADNNYDMVSKGRHPHGKSNGRSKLTGEDVRSIFRDKRSERKVAAVYGVRHTAIGMIRRGQTWREITRELNKTGVS